MRRLNTIGTQGLQYQMASDERERIAKRILSRLHVIAVMEDEAGVFKTRGQPIGKNIVGRVGGCLGGFGLSGPGDHMVEVIGRLQGGFG